MRVKLLVFTFSFLLFLCLWNCVSVEKQFEKGLIMEQEGRYEDAARFYIKVLRREPTWEEARERLKDVGARSVDILLEQAYAHESAGAYEQAAQLIFRVDDLTLSARSVGVILSLPRDYEEFRQKIIDNAVESVFQLAFQAEKAGNWPQAIREFDHLKRNYPLSPPQLQRVNQAAARVFTQWAEQDFARGRFMAAFDHTQRVIDLFGPESPDSQKALKIQKAALNAGTLSVAVLPFDSYEKEENEVPAEIEQELYDILIYEYLSNPVPFVAVVDAGRVHREVRRFHMKEKLLTPGTASRIGISLGTDFVVIGRIDSFSRREEILDKTTHRVPLRKNPASTTHYMEQRYWLILTASVEIHLISSRRERVMDRETITYEAKDKFRRGIYDGDPTQLDLSLSEQKLFDKEELYRAEQELVDRLLEELAEHIAENIFDEVLRYVR